MLKDIPCHLIAGPLGAGKTSLLRDLLAQRPVGERWAVLVNEFGQIGLDAALLSGDAQQVQVAEIVGGCLCCVNGLPFQVGLNRLLRQARPDRVLIEASGLGHPQQLMSQLGAAPWQGVLALQPLVLVLDAAALAAGQVLADMHRAVLDQAGVLLLNKAEGLATAARDQLAAQLPARHLFWTEQGRLPMAQLPGAERHGEPATENALAPVPPALAQVWLEPARPICQTQTAAERWSIGWRWHQQHLFDPVCVERWLDGLDWCRAKLVLQTPNGAMSANALNGEALDWRSSEWRRDSRLELIFPTPGDLAQLDAAMRDCLLKRLPDQ